LKFFGSTVQPYCDSAGWGGVIRPGLENPKERYSEEKLAAAWTREAMGLAKHYKSSETTATRYSFRYTDKKGVRQKVV
jgi:hypothetical protein